MAGSFQVGQRFTLADTRYRLVRDLGNGQWQAEDTNGRLHEHSQTDLLRAWNRGALAFGASKEVPKKSAIEAAAMRDAFEDAYRQSYSDEQWNAAQARLTYLRRIERLPMTKSLIIQVVDETWKDAALWKDDNPFPTPPSFASVAHWRRTYEASGRDIRSLVERRHEKGNADARLDPKVSQFIDDAIELIYLTQERRTLAEVRDEVRTQIARENRERLESERLSVPSFSTIKRAASRIPIYDRWVARYGKRVADLKFRAAMGAPVAANPLARACMDHCRMDVVVLDDATGLPLGRPWLTLVLDESTRMVPGYYLGFEEPSNVSVMRALKHALSPKGEELEAYPKIVNGWDAWGPMDTLVVDNGLEFHGFTIRNGTERFGITMQFCPRKKPWFKGKIERMFGTINTGLINSLPGKTFATILDKHDYDPSKNAIIRLSTLREILLTWIVDVYHQKLHRALGRSPCEAWHAQIRQVDRWLPDNCLSLDSAFSQSAKRTLTHKGIEFDSLLYNSQDLRQVREQYGDSLQVEVRTMDDNLGSIVVVAPDNVLIRVPAIDTSYTEGLTRWQHGVCKRYQRRLHDDEQKVLSLGEAKDRICELIALDQKLVKRLSRQRQGRFKDNPAATSPEAAPPAGPPALPAAVAPAPTPATPVPPRPRASVVAPTKVPPPPPANMEFDDEDVPDFSGRRLPSSGQEAA